MTAVGATSESDVTQRPTALIIGGGNPPSLGPSDLPNADLVIAADSGFDHGIALGLAVDVLVGDLDSISAAGLAQAERSATLIVQHPAVKDETDLEIALAFAADRDAARVVAIGTAGGRLDHQLANLSVLAGYRTLEREVEMLTAGERVRFAVADAPIDIAAPIGTTVSLLPVGGAATGVATVGLRWPLRSATLSPFKALGVSNVVDNHPATVAVASGVVAVIVNRSPEPRD